MICDQCKSCVHHDGGPCKLSTGFNGVTCDNYRSAKADKPLNKSAEDKPAIKNAKTAKTADSVIERQTSSNARKFPDSDISFRMPSAPPKQTKNTSPVLVGIVICLLIVVGVLALKLLKGNDNDSRQETVTEQKIDKEIEADDNDDYPIKNRNASDSSRKDEKESHNPYTWLSDRYLTEDDLRGVSTDEMTIMRNAIFAVHGYRFKDQSLYNHFSQYSWYRPYTSDVEEVSRQLSNVEASNVNFLKKHETGSQTTSHYSSGSFSDLCDKVCTGYLYTSELENLSKKQLSILRNTIYARHGYIFTKPEYADYFRQFSWYHPTKRTVSPSEFSPIEKANIELIQLYEK